MQRCVVCGQSLSPEYVDIGFQYPSALFLKKDDPLRKNCKPSSLNLARCNNENCCLIQLASPTSLTDIFEKYPYQSGSTISMGKALNEVKESCVKRLPHKLGEDDIVLDIGGNDGTLLAAFEKEGCMRINIDAAKGIAQTCSSANYKFVNSLFSEEAYKNIAAKPPSLITSIAMFYHLVDPNSFVRDVAKIMDKDTLWCMQMCYAGSMIANCVIDNVVHEHIAYYTIHSLRHLLRIFGLSICDAELIDLYGGSIRVFIKKDPENRLEQSQSLRNIIDEEKIRDYNRPSGLIHLDESAKRFKHSFSTLLTHLLDMGSTIYGFGASTKGNMLLQYLQLEPGTIMGVFDNSDKKIGTSMLGSDVEIINEADLAEYDITHLVSLPYYYHDSFKKVVRRIISSSKKDGAISRYSMIRPLPSLQIEIL
jgi:NDP-4-keto-2,6-dideoxyhexose 3-C-methyltransferase